MSLKPLKYLTLDLCEDHRLEDVSRQLDAARLVGVFAKAGRLHGHRQHRCDQRFSEALRHLDPVTARHDRVAGENVVRTTLFSAAGNDQHRSEALLLFLRDLAVRQHFEFDDVGDIGLLRPRHAGCGKREADQ